MPINAMATAAACCIAMQGCSKLPVWCSCRELTAQVVKGLYFAQNIRLLAERVLEKIASSGHTFNGLHLRFEADGLSAWAADPATEQVSPHMSSCAASRYRSIKSMVSQKVHKIETRIVQLPMPKDRLHLSYASD